MMWHVLQKRFVLVSSTLRTDKATRAGADPMMAHRHLRLAHKRFGNARMANSGNTIPGTF
jgi:hypothetical protein